MDDLLQEYQDLISSTKAFLQKQKISFCLATAEEKQFFPESKNKISSSPIAPLPLPKPLISSPEKSSLPMKETTVLPHKEEKILPPVIEKKSPPLPQATIKTATFAYETEMKQVEKLLHKVSPETLLTSTAIDDTQAKHAAAFWKYKCLASCVSILHSEKNTKHVTFLKNIMKTLNTYHIPCRLIDADYVEKENQWEKFLSQEELKCIVVEERYFQSLKNIQSYLKKNAEGHYFLQNSYLLFLIDIELYLQTPSVKALLWQTLQSQLPSICGKNLWQTK